MRCLHNKIEINEDANGIVCASCDKEWADSNAIGEVVILENCRLVKNKHSISLKKGNKSVKLIDILPKVFPGAEGDWEFFVRFKPKKQRLLSK